MRVGERTAVRRAIGKGQHRRRCHQPEAPERLRFEEDHGAGKPSDPIEGGLERLDATGQGFDCICGRCVDDVAERMEHRHVCWHASARHGVMGAAKRSNHRFGLGNEHHER